MATAAYLHLHFLPVLIFFLMLASVSSTRVTPSNNTGLYSPDTDRQTHLVSHRDPAVNVTLYAYHNNLNFFYHQADLYQTGLWLYYSGDYYRGDEVTVIVATRFRYSLLHTLSSVRYSGNSRGLHQPALTLYTQTWFRGLEYSVEVEQWQRSGKSVAPVVPNFRDYTPQPQSLVTTGGAWVVFELPDLRGACRCLLPSLRQHLYASDGDGGLGVYEAGLFPVLNTTGLRSVGSAAASCDGPLAVLCPEVVWTPPGDRLCPVVTNIPVLPCGAH